MQLLVLMRALMKPLLLKQADSVSTCWSGWILRQSNNSIRFNCLFCNQCAGVEILPDAQKHVYADDGGEWGIRLGTYLDDVGTGVDFSYYANYHSKALM